MLARPSPRMTSDEHNVSKILRPLCGKRTMIQRTDTRIGWLRLNRISCRRSFLVVRTMNLAICMRVCRHIISA